MLDECQLEEMLRLRDLEDWRQQQRILHPELGDDDSWRADYDDIYDEEDSKDCPIKHIPGDPFAGETFVGIV